MGIPANYADLNYRWGLLRIWVVATIVWLMAVLISEDHSCWWRKGPWCGFWSLSTYLDDALILLGPPIGAIVIAQLLLWIVSGFGGGSDQRFAHDRTNRLIMIIGIATGVVVCGALIVLKQQDDWIPVKQEKQEMTDEEVGLGANERLARCMLQQLQGKPQGAVPYAYMICNKLP
jgi:hypothetical protein